MGGFERVDKRAIPTGIVELDRVLPQGGLLRGHLSEVVGQQGSGRTTFAISMMCQLVARGERAAVVDLNGNWDPGAFTASGIPMGWVWVVRASGLRDALWAADLLVRSRHFGAVVLDGLPAGIQTAALVRLQRWARETETAVLLMPASGPLAAPGSLRLRFRPMGVEWEEGLGLPAGPSLSRYAIEVSKGNCEALVRIECRRWTTMGRHEDVPDRKEAKWTGAGLGTWGLGTVVRAQVPTPESPSPRVPESRVRSPR